MSTTKPKNFDCCTQATTASSQCVAYAPASEGCLQMMIAYINSTPKNILWDNDSATKNAINFYIQNATQPNIAKFTDAVMQKWFTNIDIMPIQEYSKVKRLCNLVDGVCDSYLNKWCKNITREQISKWFELSKKTGIQLYADMAQMCGCHLPSSEYIYTPTQCDPVCLLPNTIKNQGKTCDQNVCIMDNININIGLNIGEKITFTTMCGNCLPGQCKCIFSNINVKQSGIDSFLGIDFVTNCGNNCFIQDKVGGKLRPIDCSKVKEELIKETTPTNGPSPPPPSTIWTLEIIFLAFLFVLFILFLI